MKEYINQGSNDTLLMQMAIQYGYKLALEQLEEDHEKNII